jgi:hypothetical protein
MILREDCRENRRRMLSVKVLQRQRHRYAVAARLRIQSPTVTHPDMRASSLVLDVHIDTIEEN